MHQGRWDRWIRTTHNPLLGPEAILQDEPPAPYELAPLPASAGASIRPGSGRSRRRSAQNPLPADRGADSPHCSGGFVQGSADQCQLQRPARTDRRVLPTSGRLSRAQRRSQDSTTPIRCRESPSFGSFPGPTPILEERAVPPRYLRGIYSQSTLLSPSLATSTNRYLKLFVGKAVILRLIPSQSQLISDVPF